MSTITKQLLKIQQKIKACRDCPDMCGTPVHGEAIETSLMLVGQAPGPHENKFDKPFAYTSGKTLFKWFESIGINEETFRKNVYITATARCFPGKSGNGDRKPTRKEMDTCAQHLREEIKILKPKFVIAVGRMAIEEVLAKENFLLKDVVGEIFTASFYGHDVEVVCLPHPSGLSRWIHSGEGSEKLKKALDLLKQHSLVKKITS